MGSGSMRFRFVSLHLENCRVAEFTLYEDADGEKLEGGGDTQIHGHCYSLSSS